MAKTSMGVSNALRVNIWEKKLFEDYKKESFFNAFMDTKGSNVIWEKKDLTKTEGDKIVFGKIDRLESDPITSGQTLEGQEQALNDNDWSLTLEHYRFGVRDKGRLVAKRPIYNMRAEMRDALMVQGAEFLDQHKFNKLEAGATAIVYTNTGSAIQKKASVSAAKTALTATGKITGTMLTQMATAASTGWNRGQTPIRKVKVMGREVYLILVHPDVFYDAWNDATFQQSYREAMNRGDSNPLFKGREHIFWKDCCIVAHENVPIFTDGGATSNVPGAHCFVLGQKSLAWAWGEMPSIVKETFDYGNEVGYAWGTIAECGTPTFDSKQHGCFSFTVARTQISDA